MKVAALDLGSNTFLCLICEVKNSKIVQVYSDDVEVVRLGQNLSVSKNFHPDALARAKVCLEKFKKIISKHQPERVLAMATSAARDAENKAELFQICQDLDIPLEIIVGQKEAEISYQGSISGLDSTALRLIVDIGGGSTEYIFGEGSQILQAQSFNIGCVRLTEQFIFSQPTTDAEVTACRTIIAKTLSLTPYLKPAQILAVAGTPTTLASVELGGFDVKKIDGYKITAESLQLWLQKLQPLTIEEKIELGFPNGRADVILVGVLILLETLKKFGLNEIVVSTRGVRYGVALEVAGRI